MDELSFLCLELLMCLAHLVVGTMGAIALALAFFDCLDGFAEARAERANRQLARACSK